MEDNMHDTDMMEETLQENFYTDHMDSQQQRSDYESTNFITGLVFLHFLTQRKKTLIKADCVMTCINLNMGQ